MRLPSFRGKGNRVIFSKGFGYRDLERLLPVTLQTRFAVESISQALRWGVRAKLDRQLADERDLFRRRQI